VTHDLLLRACTRRLLAQVKMARVSTALKLAAGIRHVLDSPFSCASSCVSHTEAVISLIHFKPARTQTLELQRTTTLRMPGCI
jgi:hypothetical protein